MSLRRSSRVWSVSRAARRTRRGPAAVARPVAPALPTTAVCKGAPCSRVSDCASGFTLRLQGQRRLFGAGRVRPRDAAARPAGLRCAGVMYCGCDGVTTVYGGLQFLRGLRAGAGHVQRAQCSVDAGPAPMADLLALAGAAAASVHRTVAASALHRRCVKIGFTSRASEINLARRPAAIRAVSRDASYREVTDSRSVTGL